MKNTIRVLILAMVAITLTAIFGFSEQQGPDSRALSRGVARKIIDVLPVLKDKPEQEKYILVLKSQAVIRKTGHITEYAILGMTLTAFLCTFKIKKRNITYTVIILGMIYAITDEIHQIFTPDRTPLVKDVIIDTIGVAIGVMIIMVIAKKLSKNVASRSTIA